MTRPHALALTDQQLALVQEGARFIPPEIRDFYLRNIADRLARHPLPDDRALELAIIATLKLLRIPVPLYLFNSPSPSASDEQRHQRSVQDLGG